MSENLQVFKVNSYNFLGLLRVFFFFFKKRNKHACLVAYKATYMTKTSLNQQPNKHGFLYAYFSHAYFRCSYLH